MRAFLPISGIYIFLGGILMGGNLGKDEIVGILRGILRGMLHTKCSCVNARGERSALMVPRALAMSLGRIVRSDWSISLNAPI